MTTKKRILFVCLGNICRSPAAEGVLQHLAEQLGVQDELEVDSAGTSSYHIGEPADKRMRTAAAKRGIELTSRSRMASSRDFAAFDLIVAMDKSNLRELHGLANGGEGKLRLLSDYLDDSWPEEVPDPYYGGDEGFDEVLDMLVAAGPKLLAELQNLPGATPNAS
ncbi:low molecular weight protein-tyrosine-phosphatase [Aureliella helgolandensis]|uniref:Low molecular weight protein-tyrosine-phosphatase YfkJ n=1 Tax=Aureliella helgolandensis TaxID=2527968 RepID=A0A518GEM5_9BACT|nr:low molecular weight protein-tyrosine-phosphatase [Aureliella helgolandensis]QDV27007.1 Low molecular weight protein-tyrosine-phosphatase YfkJ [Aureliella helgolandensis]